MIVRACPLLQERKYRITGVSVLDVVEGKYNNYDTLSVYKGREPIFTEFTLDALPMMHSLLDARPDGLNSQEEAIEWQ